MVQRVALGLNFTYNLCVKRITQLSVGVIPVVYRAVETLKGVISLHSFLCPVRNNRI